ncbi:MAG: winged helix-turn-helix transcriptional regulator [Chloroflexi bacterium]|nr:MAG: winged helix-turn-helix transcriptional regulator [Chloroflexota bacterium]
MGVKTDERRFEPGFVALVTQLNKAIHRRSSEELLGMRLKPYMTLGYVRDHPGVAQGDLEAAMFMDANAVVLLLNELETARYVVRRRDPQDRRRHIVELTTAGSHALERADRAREGLEDEVLSGISSEERKTLRRLLERILDSLLQPASEARA